MMETIVAPSPAQHPAEALLSASLEAGQETLHRLAHRVLPRILALGANHHIAGHFFGDEEIRELAETFAAILGTADLLGRALVRDREQQVLLQQARKEPGKQQESAPVPAHKQRTKWNCGPAALQMVLARYGIVSREEDLAAAMDTTKAGGTRPGAIVDAARTVPGLRVEARDGLALSDLQHATDQGIPVICSVQMHGGGHWVVVTDTDGERVTFMDPATGQYADLDAPSWDALWHDEFPGVGAFVRYGIAIGPAKGKRTAESIDQLTVPFGGHDLIDVPDVRQPNHYSCGAAASMCVGQYFGVGPATIDEWMDRLGTTVAQSTHPHAIVRYLAHLGLQVEARQGMTIDDLARYTYRGWPVIVCVQDWGGEMPDEAQFDYGHYLTVIGVGMGGRVFCQDSSIENAEYEPGGDVPGDRAEASGNIAEPGRIMVRADLWNRVWHDEDIAGNKFIHYGIAIGPPRTRESRTLLRESLSFRSVEPMPPLEALAFFRSLIPLPGLDPVRWWTDLRRRAFTLAAATNDEMLERVQNFITATLHSGEHISDAPHTIEKILDNMGAGPTPEGYGETVWRTNAMDALNQGMQNELDKVTDTFPVWRYSNPSDSRSRLDHAARNGLYYLSSVPFVAVRGADIADAANCRCVQIPVDKWTWDELQAKGVRAEDFSISAI